jgi:hypothetical protein
MVRLVAWLLGAWRAAACVEHAVVVAWHYGADNESQALMRHILAQQVEARDRYLGPRSLFLVVENDAADTSRETVAAAGQEQGDSTSLQRECSARARPGNSTHASRALREMIARPKISRNERKRPR